MTNYTYIPSESSEPQEYTSTINQDELHRYLQSHSPTDEDIRDLEENDYWEEDDYIKLQIDIGDAFTMYKQEVYSLAETKPLSKDQEQALFRKYIESGRSDQETKTIIAKANLLLVLNIAERMYYLGFDLEDRVAAGNIGLLRAIELFDPSSGNAFSTYATWWIRQAIKYNAPLARAIVLPRAVFYQAQKIRRIQNEVYATSGQWPKEDELAMIFGLNVEDIREILQASEYNPSLNKPISSQQEGTENLELIDTIGSEDDQYRYIHITDEVNRLLGAILTEVEKQIICMYYGIGMEECTSLKQIAKNLHMPIGKVERILQVASNKVRSEASS